MAEQLLRLVAGRGSEAARTGRPSPALARQILSRAQEAPDSPALVHGDTVTSFAALAEAAEEIGRELLRLPVGTDEPIAVLSHKSPATAALILACLVQRRPFLLLSPQLPAVQADLVAGRSGCRWVVGTAGRLHAERVTTTEPLPGDPLDGACFVLTTSGSTGAPKVVPLGHEQVDRFVSWAARRLGLGPDTVALNLAPFTFDLCLLDVWATLAAGGTAVLVDPDRAVFGQHLLGQASRHRVTLVQAVPMFLTLMLSARTAHDRSGASAVTLPSVRHVAFTGDLIPEESLRALPTLFPRAEFLNVYGCTETNDTFVAAVGDPRTAPYPPPLGTPIDGVEHLVLAADGTTVHGEGSGELLVRSPFQTGGYTDPRLTALRFVELTGATGRRRYYRTGDLVSQDGDGNLRLVGRADFQVKVRGLAVNLNEVEQTLLAHPQVQAAAVVAAPDELGGHRLVASAQRRPGSGLSVVALRQHCAERMHRGAVPAVVHLDDLPLPRTATGKVDRQALLARALDQAADRPRPHLNTQPVRLLPTP